MVAPHTPTTGDLAHNPGMCPDCELNRGTFALQAHAQSTELHQPGPFHTTSSLNVLRGQNYRKKPSTVCLMFLLCQENYACVRVIIGANVIFVWLVYSESSPFIEKIQAFENFFTSCIDLYDKVRCLRNKMLLIHFFVSSN